MQRTPSRSGSAVRLAAANLHTARQDHQDSSTLTGCVRAALQRPAQDHMDERSPMPARSGRARVRSARARVVAAAVAGPPTGPRAVHVDLTILAQLAEATVKADAARAGSMSPYQSAVSLPRVHVRRTLSTHAPSRHRHQRPRLALYRDWPRDDRHDGRGGDWRSHRRVVRPKGERLRNGLSQCDGMRHRRCCASDRESCGPLPGQVSRLRGRHRPAD
jgi:hypothetical protein